MLLMPSRWLHRSIVSLRLTRDDISPSCFAGAHRSYHFSSTRCAEVTPLRKELKDAIRKARVDSTARQSSKGPKSSPWQLTVGIEIHAQLNTIRKLFSRARPEVEAAPNASLAPFDIALPGSQPLFQLSALIPALRAAIALDCDVQPTSRFDRKHYFYHDQPSGYQITQYYYPFARNGSVSLTSSDGLAESDGKELVVGIKQIQMEQDTAKTQELEDGTSFIDFGRSGQPLIEIISLPHIHSPEAASAYLRKIQAILFSVDSVTTGMELGGLRADVNVSVRRLDAPAGEHSYSGITGLGQRTEIKNLSSFRAVEDAIKAERDRQIEILEAGGRIEGETRGWSATSPNTTRRLRGKEGEVDYRYMPDPDIPPLQISDDLVTYLKKTIPPVPERLTEMLVNRYGLKPIDAKALLALDNGQRMIYFQDVAETIPAETDVQRLENGKAAANWVLHELGALLSTSETIWTPQTVPADSMAGIIGLLQNNKITGQSAKKLLRMIFEGEEGSVNEIASRKDLWFDGMNDEELRTLASKIIDEHPDTVASIRKGNPRKIGFLVGQMMRTEDRNRIPAKAAEETIKSLLLN